MRTGLPSLTTWRAGSYNGNALVEGKNACVVCPWFGHDHIPQRLVAEVNDLPRGVLSPDLNHYHPCRFATEVHDRKGKVRCRYRR